MNAAAARQAEMLDMYQQGYTLGDVAEKFGVSRQRVYQLIGHLYERGHYGKLKREARVACLREAHALVVSKEATMPGLAEQFGVTVDSLYSAFNRLGLSMPARESPLHGTSYRYDLGCRCEECRAAVRLRYEDRKLRGPPVHGTDNAYRNYGCRCDECRAAGSAGNRITRLRRKERERMVLPSE